MDPVPSRGRIPPRIGIGLLRLLSAAAMVLFAWQAWTAVGQRAWSSAIIQGALVLWASAMVIDPRAWLGPAFSMDPAWEPRGVVRAVMLSAVCVAVAGFGSKLLGW